MVARLRNRAATHFTGKTNRFGGAVSSSLW
jgi:hypothetical protein